MINITFIRLFILAMAPAVGLANQSYSFNDSQSIQLALVKSVESGLTIDEAVAKRIRIAPQDGVKITKSALSIYKGLPKTACAKRAKDGGRRVTIWPDYSACSDRIIRSAIQAGADPTEITQASAEGFSEDGKEEALMTSPYSASTREAIVTGLYWLRKLLLTKP